MKGTIIIVEDDESIRTLIGLAVKTLDYEIAGVDCGEALFDACARQIPSLVFLDVMLPGDDGFTILKKLKADARLREVPVIMLTAKSEETDKVTGLEGGAEDYITKPFGVLELLSRTKKVLSRTASFVQPQSLNYKDLSVQPELFQVSKNGKVLELTMKEYRLLLLLLENRGRVVLRDELLDKIWGINFEGETRTLDMHIKTLRQKLGDNAEAPVYIKTVRGAGYTMV